MYEPGHRVDRAAPESLRVIQFSDCHVSADPAALYRGENPRLGLESVLARARAWAPDLLVVTGDLSEDLSEASYRYLAEAFGQLDVPVLTLPGNHDDPRLQRRFFPSTTLHQPLVHDLGSWRLVLLNSAVADEVPGYLDDEMSGGLEAAVAGSERAKLIFLHHHPTPVGSPWIDKYPLRDPDRLWQLVDGRPEVRIVAWGHVHQPFTARRGNITLLGAPSTALNSLPGREELTTDHRGPACRWFELGAGGIFETGIIGPGWPDQPRGSSSQRMT